MRGINRTALVLNNQIRKDIKELEKEQKKLKKANDLNILRRHAGQKETAVDTSRVEDLNRYITSAQQKLSRIIYTTFDIRSSDDIKEVLEGISEPVVQSILDKLLNNVIETFYLRFNNSGTLCQIANIDSEYTRCYVCDGDKKIDKLSFIVTRLDNKLDTLMFDVKLQYENGDVAYPIRNLIYKENENNVEVNDTSRNHDLCSDISRWYWLVEYMGVKL